MRHRLHIFMAIMSCCFLCLTQSCGPKAENDKQDTSGKVTDGDKGKVVSVPDNEEEKKPEEIENPPPVIMTPIPEEVPVVLPPPGGGGSQGAVDDARTGNPDRKRVRGPNGVCDNGVQEATDGNSSCLYDIYGTTIVAGDSRLIGFHVDQNGLGVDLGILIGITNVSAIDFNSDGTLYAVGLDSNNANVLATIDCASPHTVNIIGPLGIPNADRVEDIDFDSNGRLFAYVQVVGADNDEVGIINPATGVYEELGISGVEGLGNGLGSTPYPSDNLFLASSSSLYTINKTTGVATPGMNIDFNPPADDNSPRINGMDSDVFTNIVYASVADASGTENYLISINTFSGVTNFLAEIPSEAPDGLEAVAVNRAYEECDPSATNPALPAGTSCSDDCTLQESDCFDGIDNDQDTLIDCEDPDCLGETCNDGNGCTFDDVCSTVSVEGCLGTAVDCEDIVGVECSLDVCVPTSDGPESGNFVCNSTLLPGSPEQFGVCTPFFPTDNCSVPRFPDGSCPEDSVIDPCFVGHCVEIPGGSGLPPTFECQGALKELIPTEDGGCLDDNPCTADDCEENGDCDYDTLDNVYCDIDENLCTVEICDVGVCIFEDNAIDGTPCDDDNSCTEDDTCVDGVCGGEDVPGETPCDDGNDCTVEDLCDEGVCEGTPVTSCFLDSTCGPGGVCVGETRVCSPNSTNAGAPCVIDVTCLGIGAVCQNDTPGACVCNNDDIACTTGTCGNGTGVCSAETTLNDDLCDVSIGECVLEECTLTGCETTVLDGDILCFLSVANISVALDVLLTTLGLPLLECNIGLQACDEGETDGLCEFSLATVSACSEAFLEANCNVSDTPIDITAPAALAICALLNP